MPRSALCCALAAAAVAGLAVAEQRVGLALTLALLLLLAAGALAAPSRPRPLPTVLAVGLALQPALRDAAWVVSVDVAATLVAGAAAVAPAMAWTDLARVLRAPLRLLAGNVVIARALAALLPDAAGARVRHGAAIARGSAVAVLLLAVFGGLFAAADPAFAEVADDLFAYDVDPTGALWRATLAVLFAGAAGALVRASTARAQPDVGRSRWVPARTELVIVLGALAVLFAAFVGVQLRVLFGGAGYVRETTGLGYGEYARQGFGTLLLVCALTLALVAVATRRSERAVRGLLGALCLLTLIVIAGAHHRLGLVEGAYGFTPTRFAGHAVVFWLAALFVLVLGAGAHRRIAVVAPRIVAPATLGALLVLSLANPDGRIAASAVERFERTGELDEYALAKLSADALPALERLPVARRSHPERIILEGLERPDGLAGSNLARSRAR